VNLQERLSPDAAFRFTEDDLEQNRKGRLSDVQAQHLRADMLRTGLMIGAAVVIVTGLGLFSARGVNIEDVQFIGLIAVPLLLYLLWYYVIRIENAIRERIVTAVTGEVNVIPMMGGYAIEIGDKYHRLTLTEARAFASGTSYTIYLIPRLNRIVAAESYGGDPLDTNIKPVEAVILPDISEQGRESLRA
jgi:hypothetical protein